MNTIKDSRGITFFQWRGKESFPSELHPMDEIEVLTQDGIVRYGHAGAFLWLHVGTKNDIIGWRYPLAVLSFEDENDGFWWAVITSFGFAGFILIGWMLSNPEIRASLRFLIFGQ